uniref:Putative conserved secreted protein n=1 Tax=Amblyomma tuberculatum TaxID=48802 RepID=A0A6M2E200_9ACAR
MTIIAVTLIVVILHATGNHALTRQDVAEPCDSDEGCLEHLCCTRMTGNEGNTCRVRNGTAGQRCSTIVWPKGRRSKSKAYIGGCPCGKGLKCQMDYAAGYGTCRRFRP